MRDFNQVLTGLTDIPVAAAAFILAFLVKKKNKVRYSVLFFHTGAAAITGFTVHTFLFSQTVTALIWVFLYPVIFEAVFEFVLLYAPYFYSGSDPHAVLFRIIQIVCCVCAAAAVAFFGKYDMFFLIIFSLFCLAYIAGCIIRSKKPSGKTVSLTLLVTFILILQAASGIIPFATAAEHFLVIAVMIILYFVSLEIQVN